MIFQKIRKGNFRPVDETKKRFVSLQGEANRLCVRIRTGIRRESAMAGSIRFFFFETFQIVFKFFGNLLPKGAGSIVSVRQFCDHPDPCFFSMQIAKPGYLGRALIGAPLKLIVFVPFNSPIFSHSSETSVSSHFKKPYSANSFMENFRSLSLMEY